MAATSTNIAKTRILLYAAIGLMINNNRRKNLQVWGQGKWVCAMCAHVCHKSVTNKQTNKLMNIVKPRAALRS